jgi:uncharacterized SAM-binding protein YcdF (DUF218 family)
VDTDFPPARSLGKALRRLNALADEGRSEKIMRKQKAKANFALAVQNGVFVFASSRQWRDWAVDLWPSGDREASNAQRQRLFQNGRGVLSAGERSQDRH